MKLEIQINERQYALIGKLLKAIERANNLKAIELEKKYGQFILCVRRKEYE